uniref:Uncharacterized protein n=1 Tax=Rhizophagus irregularis (strain DAOM 181602 / DAOM 197198 / MUCL 43194) TaxID=747089 RepID=U9U0V6_RHIID
MLYDCNTLDWACPLDVQTWTTHDNPCPRIMTATTWNNSVITVQSEFRDIAQRDKARSGFISSDTLSLRMTDYP